MDNLEYFSIEQREKLAEVVLEFIEQGHGKNKEEAESLAFSSVYKQLNKPTPQLCQYIWQEEVKKDYYARYERAIAIGEVNRKERAVRKEKEDNEYLISALFSRLLKGENISKAIESVAELLNMNSNTVNTKWYKLRKDEAVRKQYEDVLELINNSKNNIPEKFNSNSEIKTDGHLNIDNLCKDVNSLFNSYSDLIKKNQELLAINEELVTENKLIKEKMNKILSLLQTT